MLREEADVAGEKVVVENVNVPGSTSRVDATMYHAARAALLRALPDVAPGLTQAEMIAETKRYLPDDLFPGGAKAGWWVKLSRNLDHGLDLLQNQLVQVIPCLAFRLKPSFDPLRDLRRTVEKVLDRGLAVAVDDRSGP